MGKNIVILEKSKWENFPVELDFKTLKEIAEEHGWYEKYNYLRITKDGCIDGLITKNEIPYDLYYDVDGFDDEEWNEIKEVE